MAISPEPEEPWPHEAPLGLLQQENSRNKSSRRFNRSSSTRHASSRGSSAVMYLEITATDFRNVHGSNAPASIGPLTDAE